MDGSEKQLTPLPHAKNQDAREFSRNLGILMRPFSCLDLTESRLTVALVR